MKTRTRGWSEAAALLVALGVSAPAVAQNEQFIPMPSYRQGPYSAGGTSIYGGFIDYLTLLNMRALARVPWTTPPSGGPSISPPVISINRLPESRWSCVHSSFARPSSGTYAGFSKYAWRVTLERP